MWLLLMAVFVSCANTVRLYEGPKLPQQEIITVTMDGALGIKTVDDVRPKGLMRTMKLEMLPGLHTMTLFYADGSASSVSNQSVIFTAEAGKSYHISANKDGARWHISVAEVKGK
jgi:hypothetical protein